MKKFIFVLLMFVILYAVFNVANAATTTTGGGGSTGVCVDKVWTCINSELKTQTIWYCTNTVEYAGGCYSWEAGCDYTWYFGCWPAGSYCWSAGAYCAAWSSYDVSWTECKEYGWVDLNKQCPAEPVNQCLTTICSPISVTCEDGFVASCTPFCQPSSGCDSCTPDCTGHDKKKVNLCEGKTCSPTTQTCADGTVVSAANSCDPATGACSDNQPSCAGHQCSQSACSAQSGWTCENDNAVLRSYGCASDACTSSKTFDIDCNANNKWATSNENSCVEEFQDYTCTGSGSCGTYTVTDTRNKPDGTSCATSAGSAGTCSGGSCIGTISLLSPGINEVVQGSNVNFAWTPVVEADHYTVSYSSISPTFQAYATDTRQTSLPVSLSAGSWRWAVDAFSADGRVLAASDIGEFGVSDLRATTSATAPSQQSFASYNDCLNVLNDPTLCSGVSYPPGTISTAKEGDSIGITVNGFVSSPRRVIALAVLYSEPVVTLTTDISKSEYQKCVDIVGDPTLCSGVPNEVSVDTTTNIQKVWHYFTCTGTATSCSNTWTVTASKNDMDSSGNNFVYLAAVYDYGPAGDLENGGIKYPISLSVPVQKRECDKNDITTPGGSVSSQCFNKPGSPNQYLKCNTPDVNDPQFALYSCITGTCTFNDECDRGYCCTREGQSITGRPGPGEASGQCVPTSQTDSRVRQPYLCVSG